MKSLFYSSEKLRRLKSYRKKAISNAKKWSGRDEMASHSYQIMVKVIDQKVSALTVNK
ncbi:hypothetical protein ACFO5T_13175 [Dokdonia genika]|jgi:hypothetical protein|uniref:Uncharacterized protein n=1 Tax=Dokdonia genika TaxID=308113 RepID=A0ABV9LBU7_9FLAO|nr:hypothetical protein [Dokdonia sp. MED134]AOE08096.1 hypothetical protein [uncultured bacterium]EAQ40381.1 hypothetical protein MED134_06489 [Dokdonia sp. MED134]